MPRGDGLKRRISAMFEMPKEIVLNLPVVNMVGTEEVGIENYKGLIEYTDEQVRVLTTAGVLKIQGLGMVLRQITAESIVISGKIIHIGYIG